MIVYVVKNKISLSLFEAKHDAQDFVNNVGTAANGIHEVVEWFMVDDSKKAPPAEVTE